MWRDIVMVKQQNGVTLIELLITITLLGILAAQVMPLGRAWIANTQISNAEKSLVEALGKARNEALQNPEGNIGAPTRRSSDLTQIKKLLLKMEKLLLKLFGKLKYQQL